MCCFIFRCFVKFNKLHHSTRHKLILEKAFGQSSIRKTNKYIYVCNVSRKRLRAPKSVKIRSVLIFFVQTDEISYSHVEYW